MSSTNRGYNRHKADYYITPKDEIKNFFQNWFSDIQSLESEYNILTDRPDKIKWFDPCSGGDKQHEMSYPSVLNELFGLSVDTMDIREDSLADEKSDYLKTEVKHRKYHVIITNPPFYLAQEIIEKALDDVIDGGYVVMLLRLNFFGSKARFKFWQNNMPKYTYVHHKRMSFTDDGKTDSIEYMHCVWKKGEDLKTTELSVI